MIEIYIGENALIFTKFCRICYFYMNQENKDQNIVSIIQNLYGKFLLPALSLFESNPGVVEEFWKTF